MFISVYCVQKSVSLQYTVLTISEEIPLQYFCVFVEIISTDTTPRQLDASHKAPFSIGKLYNVVTTYQN